MREASTTTSESVGATHDLVIHRAQVFDGQQVLPGMHDVGIRGDSIASVSTERLHGVTEIDAGTGWVMPGLIDTHVHVYDVGAVTGPESMQSFEDHALPGLLELFLRHGITTIKSVGDPTTEILRTRTMIAAGALRGPRLLATGCGITGRNGHPAATVFAANPFARERFTAEVDSVRHLRDVIHFLADLEVDAIKLLTEGACHDGSPGYVWHNPAFHHAVDLVRLPPEFLSAGIDAAHDRGLRVTVHTTQLEAAREAVDAGADGLEHGVMMEPITDGSLIESMLRQGITYTPTLWAHDATHPAARGNVEKVSSAGVDVVLGSDTFTGAGVFGANTLKEAELMVIAGMTPLQVLTAGTSAAARQCARPDLGVVTPGKRADLLVLTADPTTDIGNIRRLAVTILGGEVVVDRRERTGSTNP
jgi:imidazolonepropionase-like amidohydrolase